MNIEEARNISNEILENYQIFLKVPSNKFFITHHPEV